MYTFSKKDELTEVFSEKIENLNTSVAKKQ